MSFRQAAQVNETLQIKAHKQNTTTKNINIEHGIMHFIYKSFMDRVQGKCFQSRIYLASLSFVLDLISSTQTLNSIKAWVIVYKAHIDVVTCMTDCCERTQCESQ